MKLHLLPFLFVILLSSCQVHRLRLDEDEVKASSLEELLKGEGLDEAATKEEMGKAKGWLLVHAASKGWLPVVHKLLLDGVPVDSKDLIDSAPLHKAAYGGHTAVVRLLLEKGATVDSKTKYSGYTPLHYAARRGHPEIVRLLLEKGATVDSKYDGSTPLHMAAEKGHTEVAALLLSHEADLTSTNNDGQTALQEAQLYNNTKTAAFLKLAEGKSQEWLEGYSKGYSNKKTREEDEEKIQAYAKAYGDAYEEAGTYEKEVDKARYARFYAPVYVDDKREGASAEEAHSRATAVASKQCGLFDM